VRGRRRAWNARQCLCDVASGGSEAFGEYQAVLEGHRGTFSHVGWRGVRSVPDEQHRSARPPVEGHLFDRGHVYGVIGAEGVEDGRHGCGEAGQALGKPPDHLLAPRPGGVRGGRVGVAVDLAAADRHG